LENLFKKFFFQDFGDSGAFPEINVLQYPLDMGRAQGKQKQSNAIAVKLDEKGDIKFSEAIARQGVANKNKIVYSKFTDLLPKQVTEEDPDLARPDQDAIKESTEKTRKALEALVTPAQQNSEFNSGANQRIIRMVEVQKDPMSPPRFKYFFKNGYYF